MSRLSRFSSRVAIATLAASGAVLLATVPAGAHSGQLFTVAPAGDALHFSTISQTDASLGALPTGLPEGTNPDGIEIFAEAGYYIDVDSTPETETFFLGTWDHTTGAIGARVELTATWGTIDRVYALDTTPDGRILTIVEAVVIDGEFPIDTRWIAEIDPTTGALTALVEVTDIELEYVDSIATDPTTGITWVFADEESGPAYVFTVDLADGTHTALEELSVVQDDLGDGYILGADFDTAGTVWFFHVPIGEGGTRVLARADGTFSAAVGATSVGIVTDVSLNSLAYDPYVAPQLAATGLPVLPLALGGAALLGAGLLAFATRRRAAG